MFLSLPRLEEKRPALAELPIARHREPIFFRNRPHHIAERLIVSFINVPKQVVLDPAIRAKERDVEQLASLKVDSLLLPHLL